jgi:hypothetical protein
VDALIELLDYIGADGFNGDTMPGIGQEWLQKAVAMRPANPVALEPQHPIRDRSDPSVPPLDLQYDVLSWSDRVFTPLPDPNRPGKVQGMFFEPLLSKYRAIEGRHQGHVCNRADRNRTEGLQHALFNGMGEFPLTVNCRELP